MQYFFAFRLVYKGNAVSDLSDYPQSDHTSTMNRAGSVGPVLNEGKAAGQDLYMTHHSHANDTPTLWFPMLNACAPDRKSRVWLIENISSMDLC